jgi:CHAD domain-containing protein
MGYNADRLRALVKKVTGEGYAPDDEERDAAELSELIDEHGGDVIRAAIEYATDGDPSVEIHELRVTLRDHYRGAWSTFGAFVREEECAYLTGKAEEVFNKFADYVDWEEYSARPEWSATYRTIELDPEDASRNLIYVFS